MTMNSKVTVIGAGRMGSALATALFHKGFSTTVWNRTGAKTEVLSRIGLSVAPNVEESVREADIVVVSLSDYSSTRQLLQQPDMEAALRGKIVVQLSSGTPMESIFADMSRRVSSKNSSGDQASLEAYAVVTRQLVSWCQDRGSDHTIPDAYVNLMERAIQEGKSQDDFACLFELLSDQGPKRPVS